MIRRIARAWVVVVASSASAAGAESSAALAKAWLARAVQDGDTVGAVLTALRTIGDKESVPLMAALSRSGDKRTRLRATTALGQIGKPEADAALLERLNRDPQMVVRAEAMAHLLERKALSPAQIQQALRIPDENVQCLAARSLARLGSGQAAATVLRKLTASTDPGTAALSRMSLLGLGDASQLPPLRKIVRDPKTPPALLALLMGQVVSEKITWAQPLAVHVAETADSGPLKLLGYKAIAALTPQADLVLADAIRSGKGAVLQIHLLHALASCKGARAHLESFSRQEGVLGSLAKFELLRPVGGPAAAGAALSALATGHPVVAEYLLNRATKDADRGMAYTAFYPPVLLQIVASVSPNPRRMGKHHVRAAQAVTLITKLAHPQGMQGLAKLLKGRHSAIILTVAAGLRWSKNPDVCELARPLLNSPYEELVIDAAMTLGSFGRPEAAKPLRGILDRAGRHRKELVAMACWYLLKINKQHARAVAEIIPTIK